MCALQTPTPDRHPLFPGIHFIQSASEVQQLPPDRGVEVAFVGRSNVGKSSTLNAIAQKKALAKVGNTPGKTRLFNIFGLNPEHTRRLVDLPGYGYAQVSQAERAQWRNRFARYLATRESLQGVFLIVDARHPIQPADHEMVRQLTDAQVPFFMIYNKADKLTRQAQIQLTRQLATTSLPPCPACLFSATTRQGIDAVYQQLQAWLDGV